MTKILVALSGGVDSAATALLLLREGFDVEGVTFNLSDNLSDVASARELASKLGIELSVVDLKSQFRQTIIDYFVKSYTRGETPAPCSMCNPLIKWQTLLDLSNERGFDKIATGHYCRIERWGDSYYVHKGNDPVKDQSYYLWALPQQVLERAVTPLGYANKQYIRAMMTDAGFEIVSNRKESMGVCFLKGTNYADFLRDEIPQLDTLKGGEVVNRCGEIVGSHDGYPFYTIGQKRGFSLDNVVDSYVVGIDAELNRITVAPLDELYTKQITLRDWSTPNLDELLNSNNISIKIRGLGLNPDGYCKVERSGNSLIINTEQPMYAPAKGQPAVFYNGDRVLGGGYIEADAL